MTETGCHILQPGWKTEPTENPIIHRMIGKTFCGLDAADRPTCTIEYFQIHPDQTYCPDCKWMLTGQESKGFDRYKLAMEDGKIVLRKVSTN